MCICGNRQRKRFIYARRKPALFPTPTQPLALCVLSFIWNYTMFKRRYAMYTQQNDAMKHDQN